ACPSREPPARSLRARSPRSPRPHTPPHRGEPANRGRTAPRARQGARGRGRTPEGRQPACASSVSGSARSGRDPPGELSSPSSQSREEIRGRTKPSTLGAVRDDRIWIAAVIPEAPGGDKLEMKKSQSPGWDRPRGSPAPALKAGPPCERRSSLAPPGRP